MTEKEKALAGLEFMRGGKGLARAVGIILHANPDPDRYPCYKVVNAQGKLSDNFGFGGLEEQKRRLEADGIPVLGGRVDLQSYGWSPENPNR